MITQFIQFLAKNDIVKGNVEQKLSRGSKHGLMSQRFGIRS